MSRQQYQLITTDSQLEAFAKEMRRYAVEHPVTDYDAFAAEARKPAEGLRHEEVNEGVVRSIGDHVPVVMQPYTRFIQYCGAQLQIFYMHITDPKVIVAYRQLNVIDNWGLPLGLMLKEEGVTKLVTLFLNEFIDVDIKQTPGNVIMALQPLGKDTHDVHYPAKIESF